MASTITEPQDSVFLKLPAELRTQVYEDSLLHAEVITVTCDYLGCRRPDLPDNINWQPPGLLQRCRQIRDEARSIYYAKNRLFIPRDGRWDFKLFNWLTALEAVDVASIRHIRITSTNSYCPEASTAILKHFWRTWIEDSGLALPKHALYSKNEGQDHVQRLETS
jgi:hypothetical protein